jgi:hypothetical protein
MTRRTTHECANRCGAHVGLGRLMCRHCWFGVPKPLRDAVMAAWDPRGGIRQSPEYHDAVAEARRAIKPPMATDGP